MNRQDQKKLMPHLQRTIDAIEDILRTGLTTASDTTIATLGVTFQEASRNKLLRLASVLRNTQQELNRFVSDDQLFSQSRLVFFLNRSWLLCKGLRDGIESNNQDELAKLLFMPATSMAKEIEVVCLGVVKKVAKNNFCAFEFRLCSTSDKQRYIWSVVFPLKKHSKVPAEGFLHLPQKQKFNPSIFLQQKTILIKNLALSGNSSDSSGGPLRIQLGEKSKVATGKVFDNWPRLFEWQPDKALNRIQQHQVSPFDVDIELQEEVYFDQYEIGNRQDDTASDRWIWPLKHNDVTFYISVSKSEEGKSTAEALKAAFKKPPNPNIYGMMHYSNARLLIQPLSIYDESENKIKYISISDKSIDKKELLAAIKFT